MTIQIEQKTKKKLTFFYAIDLWGYITSLIRYELVLIITSGVSVGGIGLNESYVEDASRGGIHSKTSAIFACRKLQIFFFIMKGTLVPGHPFI